VSAFAFGHHHDVIQAARGDTGALDRVAGFPPVAPPWISTILSNHDAFAGARPFDQLGGDVAMLKLAAAMYLLQPGVPFIYYGEELGMAGGRDMSADESLRTPMSWTDSDGNPPFTHGTPFRQPSANAEWNNYSAQRADPDSLFHFYKAMLALRNGRPSIARGDYDRVVQNRTALGFRRILDGEETLVAINVGTEAAGVTFSALSNSAVWEPLWATAGNTLQPGDSGTATVFLRPQSLAVFARVE
jgi:glycosidase